MSIDDFDKLGKEFADIMKNMASKKSSVENTPKKNINNFLNNVKESIENIIHNINKNFPSPERLYNSTHNININSDFNVSPNINKNFYNKEDIEELINIQSSINTMVKNKNFNYNDLKDLVDRRNNFYNTLNLEDNKDLKNYIDVESNIKNAVQGNNYTYEELEKLVKQRDFLKTKLGFDNINQKPRNVKEEKEAINNVNQHINKERNEELKKESQRRKEYLENVVKNKKPKTQEERKAEQEKNKEAVEKLERQINPDYKPSQTKEEYRKDLKEKIEKEKLRRKKIIEERQQKIEDKKWYTSDSFVGRLISKHKKRVNDKKLQNRQERINKEKQHKQKMDQYESVKDEFEDYQEILKHDDFFKMYSDEKKEVQDFLNNKENQFKYRDAVLETTENKKTFDWLKQKISLEHDKRKYNRETKIKKRFEDKKKTRADREFSDKYINKTNKNEELKEKLNDINGPLTEEEFNKINPDIEEYQSNEEFLNENKERFENVSDDIKQEIYDKLDKEKTDLLFKERESKLLETHRNNKNELKEVKKKIRNLNKNKKNMTPEEFRNQMNPLLEEKTRLKEDVKKSRLDLFHRKNPDTYQNEINKLNKDLKVLDNLDSFKQAEKDLKDGNITQEKFNNIKTELFGDGDIPKPNRTREEIEQEIEKNKKLLTKFGGELVEEGEEDITKSLAKRLKNIGKFNVAFSGINAISQYKDSRKQGNGIISSVGKAGLDFAMSEMLGGGTYFAMSLMKEVPGLLIKGTEELHKQVRNLNTSSRFTVFGQAEFQDTQQLATMRQSGMELAKMSQYRLEQTLMGNEAKYLHM